MAEHTGNQGFDVVFDTIGGEHLAEAFAAARLEATITSTIGLANFDRTPMHVKALQLYVHLHAHTDDVQRGPRAP